MKPASAIKRRGATPAMLPILVHWGPFVLPAWHTCYALGAILAFVVFLHLGKRAVPQIDERDLSRLFALCYVAGYVGARLLSILIEEPDVSGVLPTLAALARFGPMTFYGGALAAALAGSSYALRKRLPVAALLDAAIPAGLLALAVGRVGCFLNGDDYGRAVPLAAGSQPPFWAVTFPNLDDGIARYPVQLIEAAVATVLALLLCHYFRRLESGRGFVEHIRSSLPPRLRGQKQAFVLTTEKGSGGGREMDLVHNGPKGRPGLVAYLGIIGYANARFGLEFLRDDFRGFAFGTWLSTSQFISLCILAGCACSIPFWLRLAPPERSLKV